MERSPLVTETTEPTEPADEKVWEIAGTWTVPLAMGATAQIDELVRGPAAPGSVRDRDPVVVGGGSSLTFRWRDGRMLMLPWHAMESASYAPVGTVPFEMPVAVEEKPEAREPEDAPVCAVEGCRTKLWVTAEASGCPNPRCEAYVPIPRPADGSDYRGNVLGMAGVAASLRSRAPREEE